MQLLARCARLDTARREKLPSVWRHGAGPRATSRWQGDLLHGKGTSPEEMPAAYSSCLEMNFSGVRGGENLTATSIDVAVEVTLAHPL